MNFMKKINKKEIQKIPKRNSAKGFDQLYVSVPQLAKMFGVSKLTIHGMIKKGTMGIRHFKFGNRWYFVLKDIHQIIENASEENL